MAAGASSSGAGSGGAIRAGRAFVEIFAKDSVAAGMAKIVRGLSRPVTVPVRFAAAALGGTGKALSSLGAKALGLGAGLTGAAGLAGGVGLKGVLDTLGETAQLDKAAKAFGLTAEAASGLFGVLKANGAENARENIESLVTLSGRIKDVMTGTGEESKKLFDGLSVSAEQLSRLSLDEQFFKIHEAIMQLPDPIDRVNRLMLAFGEDGGKTLIGTLSQSTDELRRQAKGFELTRGEMAEASAAQLALNTATAASTRVWQKLAGALAPTVAQAAEAFTRAAGPAANWIGQNREAVVAAAALTLGVGAAGFSLVGLGTALSAGGVILGTVATAAGLLASPLGAASLAAAGLAGWFLTSTDRGKAWADQLTGGATAAAESFAATVTTTWKGVKDAVAGGDLQLAGEIAFTGLSLEFEKATAAMTGAWKTFQAEFEKGWKTAAVAFENTLGDMQTKLAKGLPKIVRPLLVGPLGELNPLAKLLPKEWGPDAVKQLDQINGQEKQNRLAGLFADIKRIDAETAGAIAKVEADGRARIAAMQLRFDTLNRMAGAKAGAAALAGEAKAAGPKLSGAALLGLGAAGPLAQIAGAGAFNAAGIALPEAAPMPPPPPKAGQFSSLMAFGGFGDLAQQFGGGGAAKQQIDAVKQVAEAVKLADGKMADRLEKLAKAIYDNAGSVKFV